MFDSPGQVFRVPAKTTDTGPATKSQKIEIVAAWFETHGTRGLFLLATGQSCCWPWSGPCALAHTGQRRSRLYVPCVGPS